MSHPAASCPTTLTSVHQFNERDRALSGAKRAAHSKEVVERAIVELVLESQNLDSFFPTQEQIAERSYMSTRNVQRVLKQHPDLKEKGRRLVALVTSADPRWAEEGVEDRHVPNLIGLVATQMVDQFTAEAVKGPPPEERRAEVVDAVYFGAKTCVLQAHAEAASVAVALYRRLETLSDLSPGLWDDLLRRLHNKNFRVFWRYLGMAEGMSRAGRGGERKPPITVEVPDDAVAPHILMLGHKPSREASEGLQLGRAMGAALAGDVDALHDLVGPLSDLTARPDDDDRVPRSVENDIEIGRMLVINLMDHLDHRGRAPAGRTRAALEQLVKANLEDEGLLAFRSNFQLWNAWLAGRDAELLMVAPLLAPNRGRSSECAPMEELLPLISEAARRDGSTELRHALSVVAGQQVDARGQAFRFAPVHRLLVSLAADADGELQPGAKPDADQWRKALAEMRIMALMGGHLPDAPMQDLRALVGLYDEQSANGGHSGPRFNDPDSRGRYANWLAVMD